MRITKFAATYLAELTPTAICLTFEGPLSICSPLATSTSPQQQWSSLEVPSTSR